MRHSVTRALTALALGAAVSLMPAAARGEVIDRILAVVNRELITLSDVAAAIRLGLVSVPQQGPIPHGRSSMRSSTVSWSSARPTAINRRNQRESQIQARMEAVRSRFSTPAAFAQALANSGLSEDQLMLRLREDLRIEAYLNQRFGVPRPPSDQELIDYYRAHTADFSTAAGVRPFAEVREQIRARLAALQRASLVADWLTSLKRRTEIADLYVSSK